MTLPLSATPHDRRSRFALAFCSAFTLVLLYSSFSFTSSLSAPTSATDLGSELGSTSAAGSSSPSSYFESLSSSSSYPLRGPVKDQRARDGVREKNEAKRSEERVKNFAKDDTKKAYNENVRIFTTTRNTLSTAWKETSLPPSPSHVPSTKATLFYDPTSAHQSILGFGGAFTEAAGEKH